MEPARNDATLADLLARLIEQQQSQSNAQNRIIARDLFWRNMRAAVIAVALIAGPIIYSFGLNTLLSPNGRPPGGDYAAVVRVDGMIAAKAAANAEDLNRALVRAFRDEDAVGVVLLLDSPGGSAVQSALIHDRIVALREAYPTRPVWSVGVDRLTSGAYLVAAATEHICVSPATLTGSIGVVYSSWGLDRVLDTVGVERRLFTGGEHKDRLDMFSALEDDDRTKMSQVLDRVHAQYIGAVTKSRGPRLAGTPADLFSGDFWVGEEAVELGLADELCTLADALEDLGAAYMRDFTPRGSLLDRVTDRLAIHVAGRVRLHATPRPMFMH